MTTLDGARSTARRRDGARLRRERPFRDRRDHGRPGLRGLRRPRGACCSRSRTGTGPTSCGPRGSSASARRPPRASRSSSTRSSACRAGGSPRGSVRRPSSAGRSSLPGTIDVAAGVPPPVTLLHPARCPRREPAGDVRSRRPTRRPTWSGSDSGWRSHGEDLSVDGATRPPLRRDPRGRPDRGGRPRPRARRAPSGDSAVRRRPGRGPDSPAAPQAALGGHDAGPRLRRDRRLELHRPGGARAPADPRRGPRAAGIADLQPALRGSVGDAHDAARLAARRRPSGTAPGVPTGLALFESGRVYLQASPTGRKVAYGETNRPVGALGGEFVGERLAPFHEPHRLGALSCGGAGRRPRGGARRCSPISSRSRGCSRPLRRSSE